MSCKNTPIPICQNLAAPDFTPGFARKGPEKRQGLSSGFSTETEKRAREGLRRGGGVTCQDPSQEQTLAIWHRFWAQVSFRAELKTHRLVTQNGRDSSMMVNMR